MVLETLGGDVSDFTARHLTSKVASQADLVITMTKTHRDAVLELAPRQLQRTFGLTEAAQLVADYGAESVADLATLRPRLARQPTDIPDPIGQDPDVFATVGAHIAELLPPILKLCRNG
jgi:protein-tyrosine phosphatase